MALAYAILLAAIGLVAIIAVSLQSFSFRRAECRQKEEEIRERARSEQAAEKKRVERVEQLALQDSIGDEIIRSWVSAWKRAGKPPDRKVFVIRRNYGQDPMGASYYIEIGRNNDPITTKLWMNLNLRLVGKEISLTGVQKFLDDEPDNYLTIGLEGGKGFVQTILKDRIFPEAISRT